MQQVKTVKDFSTYAAAQFLRTAVFIDDKIYNRKTKAVEPVKNPKTSRKRATGSANNELLLDSPEEADEDHDFSPQQLVNSFAKKQIVCSLYQPGKSASFSNGSDVYQLCLAADIVILDWDLGGTPGEKALELISCLIYQSVETIPEQLRLILVYTSESDLGSIASDVFDKLTKISKEAIEPQKEDEGLSMHSLNSRVVVLGKPGHRIEKYKSHEVSENELAHKSIEEFSKLASGLLQGTVLLGLAKIRENSRKVLFKFDKSLAPAFLVHRAMSLPDEEACEHVHPLLVAEIQSILQDCLSGQIISNSVIKNWVSELWKPTDMARQLFVNDQNSKEFIEYFCLNGEKIKEKYQSNTFASSFVKKIVDKRGWKGTSSDDRESLRKLADLVEINPASNSSHKLAMLMSHRTFYRHDEKSLTLGTIIRKGTVDKSEYLLCLLPSCDTVRLSEKRRFVFCTLNVMNQGNSVKEKTSHIIEDDKIFKELLYSPNSYNCVTLEFEPNPETKKVMAEHDENNNLSFICKTDEQRYKWIAQLKPEHAQRAAEQFSSDLSRIGLTESEWLRLMHK
jgi:hypothetical protein